MISSESAARIKPCESPLNHPSERLWQESLNSIGGIGCLKLDAEVFFNVFVHVSLIPSVGQCLAQVFCRGSEESGEIDHLVGHAAVYNYVCSIYEVVAGQGEEDADPGNVLGCAHPS